MSMPNSAPRILLVDDDSTNLMLLEDLLFEEGYTCQLAESGQEALDLATESKPDLILLDIMMPDMDGFEVCRRLREDAQMQTVPVIFLTALNDDESRLRGLELMGDDYLTKPINSKLLLTKIESTLRLNQMRSQQSQTEINQQVKEQSRQQIAAAWEVNDFISEKFRLFVPQQYLERIAPKGVESIQLGNAREEEMTVLLCDIRGFTALAETQPARETFAWLNAFFTQMSEAVAEHRGFIDKFLGDALLAVFTEPESHGEDALKAAVAMQDRLNEFNDNRHLYNLKEPVKVGIGIHTGIGLIGTVGSDDRMDSTVIGDVVNTAARLEELTKRYGCSILASEATIAKVRTLFDPQHRDAFTYPPLSFYSRWVDRVTPRGKQQALDLYEILGSSANLLEGEKLRSQTCYNSGIQALQQAEFSGALHHFQQVLAENPADATARFHAKQCQAQLGTISSQEEATRDGLTAI